MPAVLASSTFESRPPATTAATRAAKVLYEVAPGELAPTYEDGSYALLVGVSDYDDDKAAWADLPAIKTEISELATVLERVHGFEVEKVLDPTGVELVAAISDFVNRQAPKTNARVLLFFSGHGDTTLNKATNKKSGWFIPRDAPRYQDSRAVFSTTALSMNRVDEWLQLMEAKHVLWIFDSCFSGEALRMFPIKGDEMRPWEVDLHLKNVRRIITAGSENEKVPARSRFAEQIVKILRGDIKVGDQDNVVTGDEIGDFLKKDLVDFSRDTEVPQHPQSDTIIIPDSESGDIIFRIEPELVSTLKQ